MLHEDFSPLEELLLSHSNNKIIPGLERINRVLERLGNPQDSFRGVHIVGTNGKGSTGAFISSVLKSSGYRTAFYSSPHLVSPAERLMIDGEVLPLHEWIDAVSEAASVTREGEELPSYFELLTAGAFLLMKKHKVEAGVIEAGLGGKLDATNTMHNVTCSVVASVSIDHTEYLGPTLESIAGEKFAVARKNTPACFSGSPETLIPMFRRVCDEHGALSFVVGEDSRVSNARVSPDGNTLDFEAGSFRLQGVRTRLIGGYQVKNAGLALSALSLLMKDFAGISESSIREGMMCASWPGRLEVVAKNPYVLLDGGHNYDGVANLCAGVRELWPGVKNVGVVYAAMKDKDYTGCLELLSRELSPKLYVTTVPGMPRAASPARLREASGAFRWRDGVCEFERPEDAIEKAREDGNELVIVCGSLYLVGYVKVN